MKIGKTEKIDWKRYSSKGFKMPKKGCYLPWGCGGYALHALTGHSFKKISKLAYGHWPTKLMISYLKKNGFTVTRLTIGNIVEAYSVIDFSRKPRLDFSHVILLDQKCYQEENTWSVIHGGKIAHSGEVKMLDGMEFIRNPIEDAYLVYHPKWKRPGLFDLP